MRLYDGQAAEPGAPRLSLSRAVCICAALSGLTIHGKSEQTESCDWLLYSHTQTHLTGNN